MPSDARPPQLKQNSLHRASSSTTDGAFRRLSQSHLDEGRLVVVAGATGHLGQEVALALLRRGHRVLALCRPSASASAVARLRRAGAQIFLAEVTQPSSYAGVAVGAAAVVSCLGARHPSAGEKPDSASAARPASAAGAGAGGAPSGAAALGSSGPFAVDRDAVVGLFREARGAGVPLFVAIGSLEGPATRGMAEFIRAKEEAFDAIRRLSEGATTWWTVVRPGALMKEFESIVARRLAAKRSFTLVGDGSALFAPVAAADLAAFVADEVVGRAPRVNGGSVRGGAAAFADAAGGSGGGVAVLNKDVTIAGPETMSYREAVLRVADAIGVGRNNVRLRQAPPWLFNAAAGALTCVGALARAGVFRWLCYCMTHDMVGDVRIGTITLEQAVAEAWAHRGEVSGSGRGGGAYGGANGSKGGSASWGAANGNGGANGRA